MVSDSELVERLREILQRSDLDTATAGSVRRQMEEDLGVDLSDKKGFIREQIDVFLQTLNGKDEEKVGGTEADEEENDTVKEEEEEEEEEDESEGKKKKKNGREGKEVKKARGGFGKVCSLSPQLQELVGDTQLARTEVVKRLWVYIREKGLQDPKNKRIIRCDDAFRAVFRVNTIDMFKMNKVLTKHIWPLDSQETHQKPMADGDNVSNSISEERIEDEEEEQNRDEVSTGRGKKRKSKNKVDKAVKKKGGGGGFTKVCSLSPQLQEVIGAPQMARTEVVKKLWSYIRENNLQDPKDRRTIICDESLRSLFKVDSIGMFQMNKALSEHIRPLNEEDVPRKSSPNEEQDKEERIDGETLA